MQYLVMSSRAGVAGTAGFWDSVCRLAAARVLAWSDFEASEEIATSEAMQAHATSIFCIVIFLNTSCTLVSGYVVHPRLRGEPICPPYRVFSDPHRHRPWAWQGFPSFGSAPCLTSRAAVSLL